MGCSSKTRRGGQPMPDCLALPGPARLAGAAGLSSKRRRSWQPVRPGGRTTAPRRNVVSVPRFLPGSLVSLSRFLSPNAHLRFVRNRRTFVGGLGSGL